MIIGVQSGQKLGEKINSTGLKALLAILLLAVGIAIAYDTFFLEHVEKELMQVNNDDLMTLSMLVKKFSQEMPVIYSLFSIFFAIALGVAAAFIRKFFSDLKKKHFYKSA